MRIRIALPIARVDDSDIKVRELEMELQHMVGVYKAAINANNTIAYIEYNQSECTEYDVIRVIRLVGFEVDAHRKF